MAFTAKPSKAFADGMQPYSQTRCFCTDSKIWFKNTMLIFLGDARTFVSDSNIKSSRRVRGLDVYISICVLQCVCHYVHQAVEKYTTLDVNDVWHIHSNVGQDSIF